MGMIKRIDSTGHTLTAWAPDKEAEVKDARRRYEEAVGQNYIVFKFMGNPATTPGEIVAQRGRVSEAFDPNTVEYVFSPEVAGG